MRRPVLVLVVVLAAIGAFTGGLAMLLDTPRPQAGATKGEALYLALCATCHGADGKGSWRAALFLVRPGDLANPVTMGQRSDKYLFDLIKHGGAPIGRPGMPAFGSTLTDEEIAEVVRYARGLARPR
jgi:mono/diheme cytochrome c family protein